MERREETEAVSTRIKRDTARELRREAKKAGLSFSALLGNIIEDYAKWLKVR